MATVRDIITQALQRTGIIGIGRDAKAQEADSGLFILQGMIDGWFASGVLGAFTDVLAASDYTAKEYDRIAAADHTITIPSTFETDGVVRSPKRWAAIIVDDINWLWENEWVDCTGLALGAQCPFSNYGQDGLACLLATNWVDTFGGQVSPYVQQRAREFHGMLLGNRATATGPVEYF